MTKIGLSCVSKKRLARPLPNIRIYGAGNNRVVPIGTDDLRIEANSGIITRGWQRTKLSPSCRLLLIALVARGTVTNDELAWMTYEGREDGGPEDLEGIMRVRMSIIKQHAMLLGLVIRNRHGVGYECQALDAPMRITVDAEPVEAEPVEAPADEEEAVAAE